MLLNINLNSSWDETKRKISDELCVASSKGGMMVQYLDDEDDWITVTTDSEWQEALKVGSYQNYCNHPTVNLKVTVSECTVLEKTTRCCSEFMRPIPPDPTTKVVPTKIVNPTGDQYKYTGEALRAVTLPLGPIGGGCIAVAGDGGLRQWQVSNRISHLAHVPDSFFAIRVDDGTVSKAVVLQSPTLYDDTGFVPAAYITDHVVPEASKELLSRLPGVKTVEVTAKYPVVEVDYTSGEVPVNVHMEAFNPCIPLDSKNSGLPVIIFNFTVTNSSSNAATVAVLGSLQNFVGWDGASDIINEVYNSGYRGNVNTKIQTKDYTAIDMSNPTLNEKHPYNGHVTLAGVGGSSVSTSYMLQYNSVGTMWQYFITSGLPGQGQTGPSPNGMTWNGALSLKSHIPAGGKETFTFILGWHFPNRYVNWDQRGFGITDEITQFYLGNMYCTYWSTIEDVLEYTVSNLRELTTSTYAFRDAMFDSTLPWQLVDSAAGRVSVIRSPSTMWLADGNFYCFEGCSPQTGCCPLNCTHVLNYEMCLPSDSQMSASQNSQYPNSLELFSQNGSACSAPLPIAHIAKSHCKPTSDLNGRPRTKKDKKHYMKYLSAGQLSDTVTCRASSQPATITIGSVSKFEDWKTEKNNEQIMKNLESNMKSILDNTDELMKSVCTLQASFKETNEQQSNELQSLSTEVNNGFSAVQEKFNQMKSEDKLLINKLIGEISELKEDIVKKDKQLEEMHKEIIELKSGEILVESVKKTFQVVLKEFFTAEALKLFGNQRPSQASPPAHNKTYYDNDGEQVSKDHDHQNRETAPLSCQEQVPVVPDVSSHHQISAHSEHINSAFNSPVPEWGSDFSKSSGQKRTYSQRITISRKISPAISPMASTGGREYGTWGGDTSSSDHDTIEVTQLASFTRKVRRKSKCTNLSEEQNQNAAICGSWQQNSCKNSYAKQKQNTYSTQAVVPVGRFKRSVEARKRRILCDSNDAELLKISASIRQQQMNRQLK